MLCQLPRQGGVDREVQEFVYHGRTGVLPTQDLPLERTKARPTRTFPCPHAYKEEREELEQPRSALCWEWSERGWADRRSVNTDALVIRCRSRPPLLSPIPNAANFSYSYRCYPKISDLAAGPCHSSHHPTNYRISITAFICCLFFFFPHLDSMRLSSLYCFYLLT